MANFGLFRILLSAAALPLVLTACSGEKFVGRSDLEFVGGAALPEPTRDDMTIPNRPYVIGPSDKLAVDVFGIPELSKEVTVDLNGKIMLPLGGAFQASGKTTLELANEVAGVLSERAVRNPRVTVNIEEAASQSFSIDGQVKEAGIYPLVGRMSLMRAVARARGAGEFARQDYVVVFRKVGGRDYAALYDLGAIRAGMYSDPEIFSNDVIYVGVSEARRVFKDVISTAPLLSGPVIALLN